MDCRVVVEAAVPVYDVTNTDEAVRIAISKTGEMLNPDLNYVEIGMGSRRCDECGDSVDPAFVAADEALVALELAMTAFSVEGEQHASRITRKEIGQRLDDIPLKVLDVIEVTGGGDGVDSRDPDSGGAEMDDAGTGTDDTPPTATDSGGRTEEEDVLPEFEDMLEEK
jgi:uncharacterized protein (UPF0212 family)